MTHKSFYQAAAAEVSAGHIDNALWIKVCADMPQGDNASRQAKYIQLRAEELAVDDAKNKVQTFAHRTKSRAMRTLRACLIASVVVIALFLFILWPLITGYDIRKNQSALVDLTRKLEALGPTQSVPKICRSDQAATLLLPPECRQLSESTQNNANNERLTTAYGVRQVCENLHWVRENRFEGKVVLSLIGESPLYKVWCDVPEEQWPVAVRG